MPLWQDFIGGSYQTRSLIMGADQAINVFEGKIQIVAAFPKGTFLRKRHLFGTLIAQACTNEICLPPATLPLPQK